MQTNTKVRRNKIKTYEGAPAKRITPEQQLQRSVLSCFLWEDNFYEDGVSISDRIAQEAAQVSPEFLSTLAIKARTEFKLRHVPLLLLTELAKKGGQIVRETTKQVIQRPDELSEVIALLWRNGKCNIPKQLAKGIADSFHNFDEYQFAKYNRDRAIKLRDVMFLVHPKPDTKEKEALFKRIAENTLATPNTWEARMGAGEDKHTVFTSLLQENKLGYMALLRNLRGMSEVGVDRNLILSALDKGNPDRILPFRFIAALKHAPHYAMALDKAMQKALKGMDKLSGTTTLLIDISGSMGCQLSSKSDLSRLQAGIALAILLVGICEDLRIFSFSEKVVEVPVVQGMALEQAILSSQDCWGTYLGKAVSQINRQQQDRLIVITDEQSHDSVPDPTCNKSYMINVATMKNGVGYGKWTHIDGFSEACIKFIQAYERDIQPST